MALAAGFIAVSASLLGMVHLPAATDLCGLAFALSTFLLVGVIEARQ